MAISRKCENSFFDELPQPSAMLAGIELAALYIWLCKAKSSDLGNVLPIL